MSAQSESPWMIPSEYNPFVTTGFDGGCDPVPLMQYADADTPNDCDQCEGSPVPGAILGMDYVEGVQRCDQCEKFDNDLNAAIAVVVWLNANHADRGPFAVGFVAVVSDVKPTPGEFSVGDLALHRSGGLDAREVVEVSADRQRIKLSISGTTVTSWLSASSYTNEGKRA